MTEQQPTPPPEKAPDRQPPYTPMVAPVYVILTLCFLVFVLLPANMALDALVRDYDPRPGFLTVGALIALCLGVPIGRYWRNGGGG